MDKKSLSYHTKVQDWSQLYKLTADGKIYKDSKDITFLSPQKIQEIDSWRNNVRKKLNKNKPSNNNQIKDQSTAGLKTSKQKVVIRPERSRSATTNNGRIYNDTDLHSVSNHLAETSVHYANMRKDIYNTNNRGSIHTPTKPILNGTAPEIPKKIDKVIQFQTNVENKSGSHDSIQGDDEDIETISLVSTCRMTDRGKVIHWKDKTMVSVRSMSNNLLNVISIDDCKMALERQQMLHSANSDGNKSAMSEYKTTSSVGNSENIHSHELRSVLPDSSVKTTSYYPSTNLSRSSSRHPKPDRKARVTKAIDTMVNDRRVMNNLDRNFDTRIGTKNRLVLQKNEGGIMFKKLHSALRKHVDNILAVQAHSRIPKYMTSMENQFSSYIQQFTNSAEIEEKDFNQTPYTESQNSRNSFYQSHSSLHSYKEPTIFEEENENEETITHSKRENNSVVKEQIETVNGHKNSMQRVSSGKSNDCSSSNSSISIQNFSDMSIG